MMLAELRHHHIRLASRRVHHLFLSFIRVMPEPINISAISLQRSLRLVGLLAWLTLSWLRVVQLRPLRGPKGQGGVFWASLLSFCNHGSISGLGSYRGSLKR